MLSLCWDSWDALFRVVNRLTIIAACGYGCWWYGRRAVRSVNVGIIPRGMYVFLSTVMGFTTMMVVWLVATCHVILSWQERTVFGAALVWTIIAQLALIKRGTERVERSLEQAREYRKAVEQAAATVQSSNEDAK